MNYLALLLNLIQWVNLKTSQFNFMPNPSLKLTRGGVASM
jgi:hypothetical protein